jgi:hypothetical protein
MNKLFAAALCGAVALISVLPSAHAQQKTAKACQEEWRANKAANQAAGKTEKAYVAECRSVAVKTEAAKTPAAKPAKPAVAAPAAAAPKSEPTKPATTVKPATTAPTGANQFTTEGQAKLRCPLDTVVWVNLSSRIYHFSGTKDYGTTKRGAYMCEKDTAGASARAAKNEKHP